MKKMGNNRMTFESIYVIPWSDENSTAFFNSHNSIPNEYEEIE